MGVGFLWLREHDARVRAEGRAEALAKQVDSLETVASNALRDVAALDRTVGAQKIVLAAQQKQIEEVGVKARRQTQAAVSSLREELDDRQRTLLDTITAGYEKQLDAKDRMYAAQAQLTALANAQVASRDTALAKIQQASRVVYDAWQAEKKRASPSLMSKVVRALPVIAATALVTHLAWR